ncbi:MAG TPA: SDR family oxidoreductase [Gemmatimonadales bacterium]|jgi:NAD(P)-dependent dehydrogenase (short-subunit alcohol dehydrogenase family)
MTAPLRSVLVTGAARGIGHACTRALEARGFRVFAAVRRAADGTALRAATDGRIVPIVCDVTDADSVASAAREVADAVGPAGLWGLVNNAGTVCAGPLEFLPVDAIREQFEVNVFGLMALTQACLPLLRTARGRVVNVSSVSGRLVSPFSGAYAASKFALEALSDGLRMELSRSGVRVVVVQPGAVQTSIWGTSRDQGVALAAGYPADARRYYGRVLERLADVRVPSRAIPAERVAVVVARALTRRWPRTRYRVGWDARVGTMLARLLPGRLLDALLLARRRRQSAG